MRFNRQPATILFGIPNALLGLGRRRSAAVFHAEAKRPFAACPTRSATRARGLLSARSPFASLMATLRQSPCASRPLGRSARPVRKQAAACYVSPYTLLCRRSPRISCFFFGHGPSPSVFSSSTPNRSFTWLSVILITACCNRSCR